MLYTCWRAARTSHPGYSKQMKRNFSVSGYQGSNTPLCAPSSSSLWWYWAEKAKSSFFSRKSIMAWWNSTCCWAATLWLRAGWKFTSGRALQHPIDAFSVCHSYFTSCRKAECRKGVFGFCKGSGSTKAAFFAPWHMLACKRLWCSNSVISVRVGSNPRFFPTLSVHALCLKE